MISTNCSISNKLNCDLFQHPPVNFIISDGFLFWTQDSAEKLGIPRLCFYGINIFSMAMCNILARFKPHAAVVSDDEPFPMPEFPRIKLTVNDFEPSFSELDPKGPALDFLVKQQKAMIRSHGMVGNSFYELEPEFVDYRIQNFEPKAWLVGPFCFAKPQAYTGCSVKTVEKPTWIKWLDTKLTANEQVLYVSFGTQAEASTEQLREVAIGLEQSNISFMWVVKPKQLQLIGTGFEDRVKGRGKVVTEWVDQVEILKHESVCGFLSHCGWNSVLESMCAGVGDAFDGRATSECENGGGRDWDWATVVATGYIVEAEEVAKMAVELMEGEGGKRVRNRVNEVKECAFRAMKEGGSSSRMLDSLVDHVCGVVNSSV